LTNELDWLLRLSSTALDLPLDSGPRPYWSQRQSRAQAGASADLPTTVRRVQVAVEQMTREHWFAQTLGFDCCDGTGDADTTLVRELDRHLGKPQLVEFDEHVWSEDDLCDYVEVLHDLAARPTRTWYHDYSNCGIHPIDFHRASGQALYRWKINQILDQSSLGLRLADSGDDVGRIVRTLPTAVEELVEQLGDITATNDPHVPHAIAQYRTRGATREDKKAAVIELGSYVEEHKGVFFERLGKKSADPFFELLNKFALRHRRADQADDYPDEILDWAFQWALATVRLVMQLSATAGPDTPP
jgi:hypothetical protein